MADDAVRAWSALLRVHSRLAPVLDRELQEAHGLPLTWYDVLTELNEAEGRRLTMGELGEAAFVTRTRVTRVVDELVRAGMVERDPNPDDARSMYAVITRLGRDRLRRAEPTYRAGVENWFGAHLTKAEARSVAVLLERVLAAEF
jgi:DNA-binding MarR family transcriptional regulator